MLLALGVCGARQYGRLPDSVLACQTIAPKDARDQMATIVGPIMASNGFAFNGLEFLGAESKRSEATIATVSASPCIKTILVPVPENAANSRLISVPQIPNRTASPLESNLFAGARSAAWISAIINGNRGEIATNQTSKLSQIGPRSKFLGIIGAEVKPKVITIPATIK